MKTEYLSADEVAALRAEGKDDDEIAEIDAECLRDAQSEAASYDDEPTEQDEPTYGPARLRDDGYYARNDAGEYAWM